MNKKNRSNNNSPNHENVFFYKIKQYYSKSRVK